MFFTLLELFDMVVMTLAVGFIFMDLFAHPGEKFNKKAFLFAILVAAPAIILHEFGHRGCGHHTGSEGNSPEVYSQHEVEANTWAINLISQKYNHLAWAKSAKEYLLKRNELELHKPKDK